MFLFQVSVDLYNEVHTISFSQNISIICRYSFQEFQFEMILWPALNLNSDHVWRLEQTCLQLWAWNLLWHKAALMTNDLFAPSLGGSRSIFAIYLHSEMTALLCCSTEALRENLLIQGRLLNWNFTQVLQEQQTST